MGVKRQKGDRFSRQFISNPPHTAICYPQHGYMLSFTHLTPSLDSDVPTALPQANQMSSHAPQHRPKHHRHRERLVQNSLSSAYRKNKQKEDQSTYLDRPIPIESHWEDSEPGAKERTQRRVHHRSFHRCLQAAHILSVHVLKSTQQNPKENTHSTSKNNRTHSHRSFPPLTAPNTGGTPSMDTGV